MLMRRIDINSSPTFRKSGLSDTIGTYGLVSGVWTSTMALGMLMGPLIGGMLLDYTNDYRLSSLYPLILVFATV